MWLNQLFSDGPIDFEKRCRTRILVGKGVILLGFLSLAVTAFGGKGADDFIPAFYTGIGVGLVAGGIASVMRNRRYLTNPDLKKERAIAESDERNRLLGLRCWAFAGYSMFLILYVGILISGFSDRTVAKVLLAVAAVYALLLGLFRFLLGKSM